MYLHALLFEKLIPNILSRVINHFNFSDLADPVEINCQNHQNTQKGKTKRFGRNDSENTGKN